MRRFGRWLGRALLALFLLLGAAWLVLPRDQVDRAISFDSRAISDDPAGWLQKQELQFSDIVPGTEKRIVWAGQAGVRTPIAVVYLHGFSATSEEIRPVPDQVAQALGANLFFARLAGHGRTGAALAEVTAGDWIEDLAEAMAIGRALGDRVVVIATSTGGTLAAIGASDPALSDGLAGVVMVSPNFGLASPAAVILDLPGARWWGPLVAGAERSFTPHNEGHARFWTTTYPTEALFPMAALVREARRADLSAARVPLLMILSPDDQVIDAAQAEAAAGRWGGPVRVEPRTMTEGDDPYSHVIAGDILSPHQTAGVVGLILDWAKGL